MPIRASAVLKYAPLRAKRISYGRIAENGVFSSVDYEPPRTTLQPREREKVILSRNNNNKNIIKHGSAWISMDQWSGLIHADYTVHDHVPYAYAYHELSF